VADIALRGVEKTFQGNGPRGFQALAGVDLEVSEREFVAIVGASGCGKTTLLNLVAGFERPTRGEILVDGRPVLAPGPDRGVVFQHSALFPWLSVRDNVRFGLTLAANRHRQVPPARIEEMIRKVGLARFADALPAQLSGGMRQRAAIASVLTLDPGVLLMDEPFGALDALTRSTMQDLVLQIWEGNRKTVLLVTHDIAEALYMADRVVVMASNPGRIREVIRVPLPRPRSAHVQSSAEFNALREHVTTLLKGELATSGI
jgi:NitT/TauT family transport system ATP-binding protein